MAEKPTYEELAQRVKDLEKETLRSKGAEEEMRASEEKFFKAFHNCPLPMTISSIKDGRYLDVNEGFIIITGYSRKETIGTTSVELGLISQDDRKTLIRELLENGHIRDIELTLHKKNGELFYCSYFVEIITVDGKQRLLSIAHDITGPKRTANELGRAYDELEILVGKRTKELIRINEQLNQEINERKQAEEQFRLSEERYHTVYNVAPLAFVLWDCDCQITDWNKQAEEMFGWSADEVSGRNFFEFLIPEGTRPHVEQIIEALLTGALPRQSINENLTKSGEIIICEWNSSILYDNKGHVSGAISLALDITERKQAAEALQQSEEKFRSIFEIAGAAIATFLPDGSLLEVNPALCKFLGYTEAELLNLKVEDITHPDDRKRTRRSYYELMAGQKQSLKYEKRYLRKDGSTVWGHVDVACIVGTTLKPMYCVGLTHDITERKEMEQALQIAHDELEKRVEKRTAQLEMTHAQLLHSEKLSAIGRLSASIAHEFNNPLFGIRNVLDGIEKRAALDEEDTELVGMALLECDRIKYLIQDLQDFNRPTSGIRAPVDIHKSIASILLLLKKEFQNQKIMVEKDYDTLIPNICAVGDQIKQVLLNMLNNASDAMSASGGMITITTHLLNNMIAIHIQDTGTGIKPEDMYHIFEPFFTTKSEVKGTGLGLSVSYGIIKRHGGRIDVHSEVGQGSIFTIILPIEKASR